MVESSNKVIIYIFLFIIILLLIRYYINYNIYYENFIVVSHEYEKVQLTEIDLKKFNSMFDTYIVELPTYIQAVGIDNGRVYILNQKNGPSEYIYFKDIFIPFIIKYIYPYLNNKKLYFLINLADGHGERICLYTSKNLNYYMAYKDEFENKHEIAIREDGKFPLLHSKKYMLSSCKLKNDIYTKCIPDRYYIQSTGHRELVKDIIVLRNSISWNDKKNEGVWRGNLDNGSKCNFKEYTSELNQRNYFVKLKNAGKINNINYSSENLSKEELCKYKYLLDIDGWTNTWDATIWKMFSGSVLLKVGGVWEQWYYSKLKEWVHYVPVSHDFSDLNEMIEWCKSNDDRCKEISNNAYNFVITELTFENACKYTVDVFNNFIV